MDDKYQCHICMELANKPVVTPCGHLFWYFKSLFQLGLHLSLAAIEPIVSYMPHLQKRLINVSFTRNYWAWRPYRKGLEWSTS